jgi:putative membrane protein
MLAIPALLLGLWLWLGYGIGKGPGNGWLHVKLFVVLLLVGYHHACGSLLKKFEMGRNTHSHKWYRWFNEFPVIGMLVAVIMVVVKPF